LLRWFFRIAVVIRVADVRIGINPKNHQDFPMVNLDTLDKRANAAALGVEIQAS